MSINSSRVARIDGAHVVILAHSLVGGEGAQEFVSSASLDVNSARVSISARRGSHVGANTSQVIANRRVANVTARIAGFNTPSSLANGGRAKVSSSAHYGVLSAVSSGRIASSGGAEVGLLAKNRTGLACAISNIAIVTSAQVTIIARLGYFDASSVRETFPWVAKIGGGIASNVGGPAYMDATSSIASIGGACITIIAYNGGDLALAGGFIAHLGEARVGIRACYSSAGNTVGNGVVYASTSSQAAGVRCARIEVVTWLVSKFATGLRITAFNLAPGTIGAHNIGLGAISTGRACVDGTCVAIIASILNIGAAKAALIGTNSIASERGIAASSYSIANILSATIAIRTADRGTYTHSVNASVVCANVVIVTVNGWESACACGGIASVVSASVVVLAGKGNIDTSTLCTDTLGDEAVRSSGANLRRVGASSCGGAQVFSARVAIRAVLGGSGATSGLLAEIVQALVSASAGRVGEVAP